MPDSMFVPEVNLWSEARALKAGEQELLAKVGSAYLELDALNKKQRELQHVIETSRARLEITRGALSSAISKLVEQSDIVDGDVTIDFDNERIELKDG